MRRGEIRTDVVNCRDGVGLQKPVFDQVDKRGCGTWQGPILVIYQAEFPP